jgi:hypothetical protein
VVFIVPGIKIPFEKNGIRAAHAIKVTRAMECPQSGAAENVAGAVVFPATNVEFPDLSVSGAISAGGGRRKRRFATVWTSLSRRVDNGGRTSSQ